MKYEVLFDPQLWPIWLVSGSPLLIVADTKR
jgi:hypothetical protein